MKTLIKESNSIDLEKALKYCIPKYVEAGKINNPKISYYSKGTNKGKKLILAFDAADQNTQYHFYEDGNWIQVTNGKNVGGNTWSCNTQELENQANEKISGENLTKKITSIINLLKTESSKDLVYPTTTEEKDRYDLFVKQGTYVKIDLNSGSEEFRIPAYQVPQNTFIYLPVAKNETRDQQKIIDQKKAAGYEQVNCDEPLTDDFATAIEDLQKSYPSAFSKPYCMVVKRNFDLNPSDWNKFIDEKQELITGQMNSPSKQLCRQVINNYMVAMEKNLALKNKSLLGPLKQFIRNCNSQHKFRLGTKKDLEQIIYSRKRNRNGSEYAMNEQDLTYVIRKNLIQINEQKKNFITESKIVQNRLRILSESIGKKKNNRRLVFYSVVNEVITLKKQGLSNRVISEQFEEFFNALGGFFGKPGVQGTITGGLGGTFVEYAAEFIIKSLGIPTNSPVAQLFITAIGNVGSFENIPRMLTECDFTAGLLAKSIVESIAKNYIEDYIGSGFLADALRNTLTDAAFNTDLVSGIQKNISGKVCELIGQLGDKAGDKAKEMKEKALS